MMALYKVIFIVLPIILLTNINAAAEKMSEGKQLFDLPKDCDFMEIRNNASMGFSCSPKLLDRFSSDFRGLLINGPSMVTWPDNTSKEQYASYPNGQNNSPLRLMIAGLSYVPDSILKVTKDSVYSVVIVAVDQTNAKTYSGKMKLFGVRQEEIIKNPGVSELPGILPVVEDYVKPDTVRKKYFNIDLVENLGIPIKNTIYNVYATIGEFKSNVLIIETSLK